MKTQRYIYHLSALITVVSILAACGPSSKQRVAATLDDVETYINDRPDSALVVLEGVDSTALSTRALRAQYSLLHTMALDKCYKDITAPGLLDPAVAWYENHGTADEKMKTLFYQGRIAQEKKEWNNAAVRYYQAEGYADEAQDRHAAGLLYEAMSSIYNFVHNTEKEQEYVEKALRTYKQASDPFYESALGDLAIVYHSRQEWAKADSLYQEAIAHSKEYPHSLAIYLSNYGRMKVLQPEEDPVGALAVLNQKRQISGSLTPEEAGAYAYALVLCGRHREAKEILDQLAQLTTASLGSVEAWICRCALATGDYQRAYESQRKARLWEESELRRILSDPVSGAITEYQEMLSIQRRMQYKVRLSVLVIILLVLCFAFALVYIRKNKLEADKSRMLEICSILEKEASEHETRTAVLQEQLHNIQEAARQERVFRFRQTGRLQAAIWHLNRTGESWIKKDSRLISIKEELCQIYDIDDSGEKLVRRLDRDLDGKIIPLVEVLHLKDNPNEQLFLCCCLLDLPAEMVAARFNLTSNNVRVKKHRLKDQIARLNNADYDALFNIRRKGITDSCSG